MKVKDLIKLLSKVDQDAEVEFEIPRAPRHHDRCTVRKVEEVFYNYPSNKYVVLKA